MKSILNNGLLTASVFAMTTVGAFAQTTDRYQTCNTRDCTYNNVPEIDASTGLLAMAALGAAMLLVWERRRRQA